jgi:hypothetical protein
VLLTFVSDSCGFNKELNIPDLALFELKELSIYSGSSGMVFSCFLGTAGLLSAGFDC